MGMSEERYHCPDHSTPEAGCRFCEGALLRKALDMVVEREGSEALVTVQEEKRKLTRLLTEADTRIEALEARVLGQQRMLARIRKKADLATGIDTNKVHTGPTDTTIEGRAPGAEGAVDLLVARYAGVCARLTQVTTMVDLLAPKSDCIAKGTLTDGTRRSDDS